MNMISVVLSHWYHAFGCKILLFYWNISILTSFEKEDADVDCTSLDCHGIKGTLISARRVCFTRKRSGG